MTTTPLLDELDEMIRTETVRDRHIRLVRLRAMIVTALDNVTNPPVEPITQSDQ